jgi:hypothetical protein
MLLYAAIAMAALALVFAFVKFNWIMGRGCVPAR